jgi:hypothetical protein
VMVLVNQWVDGAKMKDAMQPHVEEIIKEELLSSDKHTDIPNYSDMDIVVDCKKVITRRIQKDFLLELESKLIEEKIPVIGYARKDVAVTFDCGFISFDLLFSKPGSWCSKKKQINSKKMEMSILFHNQPVLQRTVRALKLLIREVRSFLTPLVSPS